MHGVRMYVCRLGVMQLTRDPAVRESVHAKTTLLQDGTSVITMGPSSHPRVRRH